MNKPKMGRLILCAGLVFFILAVVFSFVLFLTLRGYLKSNKFRVALGDRVTRAISAEGGFDDFRWTGTHVNTDWFKARGKSGSLFSRLRAENINARVNFGAVKRRVWEIASVDINRVNLLIDSETQISRNDNEDDRIKEGEMSPVKGFARHFFPNKTELNRIGVSELNFDVNEEDINIVGRGFALDVKPTENAEIYRVSFYKGTVWPKGLTPLRLEAAEFRAGRNRVIIDQSEFRFYDDASLTLAGEIEFLGGGTTKLNLHSKIRDILARNVLAEDWVKRLKGTIDADIDYIGPLNRGALSGEIRLKDGLLEAMPILDRIDIILGSSRFRRLSFNDFKITFKKDAQTATELSNIFILSSGTICLSGKAVLEGNEIKEGAYMIGITPETIKWLPVIRKQIVAEVFSLSRDAAFKEIYGSNEKNVRKPPEGFLWAIATVEPQALDPYTSDLRRQIFNSGGGALWGEIIGLSKKSLQAVNLLSEAAKSKGVDLMKILSIEDKSEEGFIFSRSNLLRAASELGVYDTMEGIVKGLADEAVGIPIDLLRTGTGLLDALLPRNKLIRQNKTNP